MRVPLESEKLTDDSSCSDFDQHDRNGRVVSRSVMRHTRTEKGLLALLVISVLTAVALISMLVSIMLSPTEISTKKPGATENSEATQDYQEYMIPEKLASTLNKIMQDKILATETDFLQRFPRDHRHIERHLPRPIRNAVKGKVPKTDDDKIEELFVSLDENDNKLADPWELHDWMLYVEKIFRKHVLDKQWTGLDQFESANLTWPDYYFKVNPFKRDTLAMRNRLKRDRRRWVYADVDKDGSLTKTEFKDFVFPSDMSVLVNENYEDLDKDLDGKVSEAEFDSIHKSETITDNAKSRLIRNPEIKSHIKYFREVLDADKNGFVDVEEIARWVKPEGFVQAKSEVVHLMERLDKDDSKDLSKDEISQDPKLFLDSQVSYYGYVYSLRHLRAKVFHIESP